jgi:hypothetical protein
VTRPERALAALDETLVLQVKDASNAAWGRVSGGEAIESAVEEFTVALGNLILLHEKMRGAAARKFGT